MIPNHTQQWSPNGIKIMHPTCTSVLIYCGVKEKGFESQVNSSGGSDYCFEKRNETAQKKGMRKLPETKSKARKVWRRFLIWVSITWSLEGRWWLLDVCRG